MKNNTYWHFRNNASEADEDTSRDSIMLDVSRITGVVQGADDGATNVKMSILFEKSGLSQTYNQDITNTNGVIVLQHTPGKGKELMRALAAASNTTNNKKSYVTISDDLTSEYISPHIVSVYHVRNN